MQTQSETIPAQPDQRLTRLGQAALELHQAAELIRQAGRHGVFRTRRMNEAAELIDATVYYLRRQLNCIVYERHGAATHDRLPGMHTLQGLLAALALASELEALDSPESGWPRPTPLATADRAA
jgi:hypothetical protein